VLSARRRHDPGAVCVTDARRVLVVEDELHVAEAVALVIADWGFKVSIARDGRQAPAIIDDARPELVITDYMMPMMDGAAMARALRADPRWVDLPIVVMSAASEAAMRRHAGCFDAHLRKPFEMKALFDVMQRLLRDLR
jgi:CheY-like chemotaxis protein